MKKQDPSSACSCSSTMQSLGAAGLTPALHHPVMASSSPDDSPDQDSHVPLWKVTDLLALQGSTSHPVQLQEHSCEFTEVLHALAR